MVDSLSAEIKAIIKDGKQTGRKPYLTYDMLEALIAKYESQTTNDTSDQPGEWQIRGGNVDAIQHDGTDERANEITEWVESRGGKLIRRFSEYGSEESPDVETYLRFESPRKPDVVGPNWWVVHTANGFFFAVSDSDFHIIYVPREQ